MNQALRNAMKIVGSGAKLAKLCGVSQPQVFKWLNKRIPAERVILIEKATNGIVKRWELRPDIYPPEDYISC